MEITREEEKVMNVNTYDDCNFCGGRVIERLSQKDCWWGDKFVALINNVPTGVCEQCGERYYKASVLKKVEAILAHREKISSIEVPVGDFSEA